MSDRIFTGLAVFGVLVLAGAAVWMGGLNQDEGWYLYAANLVAEGQMPYRDFQYTQGPGMPLLYSLFTWIWNGNGILGARLFTVSIGLLAIVIAARTAADLVPEDCKREAALITVFLLGCNLYHVYYLAIPKTYALASLFVSLGFRALARGVIRQGSSRLALSPPFAFAGLALAFAAGVRISLGAIVCVVGLWLLFRREWRRLLFFCLGGFLGLGLVYGSFLADPSALAGLVAAQKYHAARSGFDPVFAVGSLSRLVRWYLPVFIVLGLALSRGLRFVRGTGVVLVGFLAVFVLQMLAPFPYEDYQVPIMPLLAVFAAVNFVVKVKDEGQGQRRSGLLLVLGLCFASSFGSPLLEKWTTNGQDRFWTLKKEACELAQLREAAKRVEAIDPGGREIFTQDLYLAIETNRKVPKGLEMGPFSILSDAAWRKLIASAPCRVAAVSGYTFAVEPPKCNERPIERQLDYLGLLKTSYTAVDRMTDFGQNATTLLLLRRNEK